MQQEVCNNNNNNNNNKGKVHPRTGHEGPEGEQRYTSTLSLTSGQMGWVVNATPRPLYPQERLGTHCIGGWVVPRAGLDGCVKSRPPPHRDSIPGPSRTQRLAIPTQLSRPTIIITVTIYFTSFHIFMQSLRAVLMRRNMQLIVSKTQLHNKYSCVCHQSYRCRPRCITGWNPSGYVPA